MKGRLYKDTHRLGYNTRDNPQDVPAEACRSMVNCYPGHPSPFPREGIDTWNSVALPAAPSHVFPWLDKTAPKQILHIGQSFYWKEIGTGAATLIGTADIIPAGVALSYFRVKDMMFINTDLAGEAHLAWIIEYDGDTFTLRNANIAPPVISAAVVAGSGANMPNSKFRNYAFSFVNRNDEGSMDVDGDPVACDYSQSVGNEAGFHPGLLESIEMIDYRVTFENDTGSACAPELEITLLEGTLDPQITHLRIWVTAEGDGTDEVAGLEHRWLADVPVKGVHADPSPWTWTDFATAGELAGILDLRKTTGFDPMPAGTYMLFHLGHLWVGGSGTGEEIGRNFYSEAPQDVEFPAKWFSLFSQALNFKDVSYEDAEPAAGIGLSQNDVVFIGRRSVYYLRDGDPTFEPALIDKNKGTPFPNSITAMNQDILYVSNDGPVAIVGRQIEVLDAHTAAEVWPRVHDNSVGYFFGLEDKEAVRGFYYRESWWLTDGVKLIGIFMPSSGTSIGPWEVQVADPDIGFGLPCVLDADSLCVLTSGTQSTPLLWHFLHQGVKQDNGTDFWLKGASKAYYIDPKNRDRCGELYRLKTFCHYTDAAPLYVLIKSDFLRYHLELGYDEYSAAASGLVPVDSSPHFRNVIEQPLPEGFFGDFFEVEWRKQYSTPYNFTHKGWALEYRLVDGHPADFVSRSVGDGLLEEHPNTLLYLKFDDDEDEAEDFSLFGRNHDYAAGAGGIRSFLASFVPAGGMALVAGVGSGYFDTDWDGLDHIGVQSGFNDGSLTYEYVFNCSTLASGGPVIHEAGDGTDYWRFRVNPNGSLQFELQTSAISLKWTTAAGTIVVDTDYFIMFVLSNSGLNGQFYGGPRAGSFNNYLTTVAAL